MDMVFVVAIVVIAVGLEGVSAGSGSNTLLINEELLAGEYLVSTIGNSQLHMQGSDGNLVLYEKDSHSKVLWASNTTGHPGARVCMQTDGDLVLYDDAHAIWKSSTSGHIVTNATLQDDCNFVLYSDKGDTIWSTNTSCGTSPEPAKYILSFPTGSNPLNITVDPSPQKNYFIMLGDWGCAPQDKVGLKVQTGVANKMKSFVRSQKAKGNNLLFVGTVGDNFYMAGQTCTYWKDRWTDKYGELATDYPWLVAKGNHDWGGHDPHALCAWGTTPKYIDPITKIPYAANQINADKGGCNPKNYYLPDFGYYYTIPELNFEWIVVEQRGDCGGPTWNGQNFSDCAGSSKVGCGYIGKMQDASEEMMRQRANVSTSSNFMLIQHYNGHGKRLTQMFTDARKKSDEYTVWSAAGHSHMQECINEVDGVCVEIKTGGGGTGRTDVWKGFYVIGFDENKKMIQPYNFNDTRIACRAPCGQNITEEDILESNFYNCCHNAEDGKFCHLYDLEKC